MDDDVMNVDEDKPQSNVTRSDIINTIFKHLAKINGEINGMDTYELIERLKFYGLDTDGNDDTKRKRLKNYHRRVKLATVNINVSNNLLPYYVVIDFEATCLDTYVPEFQHEIIEFPAVLINSTTQEVEDTFQMYCKPVINPKLSDFCVELTGITQEQVDSGDSFSHVLECFENWLKSHRLGNKRKFGVVTDSPYDMSRYLFQQCQHSGIPFPDWGRRWVNIKRSFSKFYKCKILRLMNMLNYLDMEFEGRLHCGLDDAKNIARILVRMIRDGANIHPNERITKALVQVSKCSQKSISSGEQKEGANENDTDKTELVEKMENLRVVAGFTKTGNNNLLSTYEQVKRQRGKLEAKLNRELKEKCDRLEKEKLRNAPERVPSSESKGNKMNPKKMEKM